MSATAEFRLSITRALGDQLAAALRLLEPAPLTPQNVGTLEPRGGVYQLYRNGQLVYIGKADKSLLERVSNHRRKISGRVGISLSEMSFTAIYVDEDLSAVAPETLLINRHRGEGTVPWNFNGFGNKDPGRERDTSRVDLTHFDSKFPADLDYRCESIMSGHYRIGDLLMVLKRELPYVFRYQDGNKKPEGQPQEYWETEVEVTEDNATADTLLHVIVNAMPGWQATALPGYIILYREVKPYGAARKIYRAGDTGRQTAL